MATILRVLNTLLFCSHLYLSLQLLLVCSALPQGAEAQATAQYTGPYKEVYPFVDITRDQQSCTPDVASNLTCPLYIALMLSFGGDFDSSGAIPGVRLAIDQINSNRSILPGYTLHYTLMDTQCERTTALGALHTELLQPPTKIGIIGSGCSVATEPTAEVSRYYNLSHVSCVSSSTDLTNRTRFPYHYEILATEANLAFGFYGIIRQFNWKRVAILLQEENLFSTTMEFLSELLTDYDSEFDVTTRRFSSVDGIDGLIEPFDSDHRIYIVAMYSNHARRLLCEAYEQGILYPRYIFLFYGWYVDNWWVGSDSENLTCTAEQRAMVVRSTLAPVQDEFITDCSKTANSGINGEEFYMQANALLSSSFFQLDSLSVYSQQCYDATWTLAKGLDRSITSINGDTSLREQLSVFNGGMGFSGLQHFTYNNSGFVNLLHSSLNETAFEGISGTIKFNTSTGVRLISTITVYQYRPSDTVECSTCSCQNLPASGLTMYREPIAKIDILEPTMFNLTFTGELWSDGVPFDGIPLEEFQSVHEAVTVVFVLLSTAGIVIAVVCMIFNFVFRERKLIRLTSPNLNYLIGVGAVVLYIDIYFFVIPSTDPVAVTVYCNFTAWLTAIGYSLCYGTIVAKMFRVFYIFRNPTAKKRTIQDWMLALIVLMFVTIDVIILVAYLIYNGAVGTLTAIPFSNAENPKEERGARGIVYTYFFYFCDSYSRDICLGIILGYKGVLQIIALVFSFSIRKVKVKGLNDAKSIAAAIYVTSIVTAVIIVSFYSLKSYLNLYATLFCVGLWIGTTAILCLIFIPLMIGLHRDPEGESVFSRSIPSSSPHATTTEKGGQLQLDNSRTIESLQNKVKELELALANQEGTEPQHLERKTSKVTFNEMAEVAKSHRRSSKNGVSMKTVEEGKGENLTAL